jgi:uncharacterized membrane protein YkoI
MSITKVSLGQAVTGAEQQTAEKAVGADLVQDKKNGTIYYSVETLGAKTSHIVDIDALTGKIVRVKDDTRQDEHDNGEEDH